MKIEEIILNKRPDLKGSDDNINKTELNRLILLKDKEIKQILKQEEMFLDEEQDFDWELVKDYFFRKEHIKGSFTKYDNKIGLAINEINDVVLNFPYKDCIFIGGMDKEDFAIGAESFYNEIIDKDKIYQMFAPKALDNIKKISVLKEEVLEHQVNSFFEDGKLKENLLIKGNNLLGLYSLSQKMKNKIDVIYIDPPYYFNESKSSDTFAYNSNFKLSTWLVFMKNRLEVAKELLSDTGVIFISMNEDGNAHLKLLCDEIFGVNNFITNMPIINTSAIKNNSKLFSKMHEQCLVYSKKITNINKFEKENFIIHEVNKIKKSVIDLDISVSEKIDLLETKLITFYSSTLYKKMISELGKSFDISDYWMVDQNLKIFGYSSLDAPGSKLSFNIIHPITKKECQKASRGWSISLDTLDNNCKEPVFKHVKNKSIYYVQGCIIFGETESSKIPGKVKYLENNNNLIMKSYLNVSNGTQEYNNLDLEFNFENPKPVFLIKELLKNCSKKDAIVLDFFAGSGTTGHAVMDLNKEDGGTRKFILLEQMDYIESITKQRLIRAIQKEEYNEDFVYMELKENINKKVKDDIKSLSTIQELKNIIESSFDFGIFTNTLILKVDLLKEIEDLDIKSAKKLVLEKYIDNTNDYVQYHNYTILDDNEKFYN